MNSNEHMRDWLTKADATRAQVSYESLCRLLQTGAYAGTEPLLAELKNRRDAFIGLLAEQPVMCKAVERALKLVVDATRNGHRGDDVRILQNIAAMLQILATKAIEVGVEDPLVREFRNAHEGILRQALRDADEQLSSLCRFLVFLRSFLKTLNLGGARCVLLEMPSGNSVPVKLLQQLLTDVSPPDLIRVSLSRKAVKAAGISRRQLLAEQLREADLKSNDVLLYVDEWETGSNFKTVCEFLAKELPKSVFFLPAALQTDKAEPHDRYESFCSYHDKLLSAWGQSGHDFRTLLPPLRSSIRGGYFFWSEHDRTAGYRKLQVHGAVFSSMDEAITTLHSDEKALRAALQILAGQLGSEGELPDNLTGLLSYGSHAFEKAYQDYLCCREELRACADDFARGGQVADVEEIIEPIIARYSQILEGREAALAFRLAMGYADRLGSIDPANRYLFDDQAPTLVELKGVEAATHEIMMAVLTDHLRRTPI